jgi:hypothetical protein
MGMLPSHNIKLITLILTYETSGKIMTKHLNKKVVQLSYYRTNVSDLARELRVTVEGRTKNAQTPILLCHGRV